MAAAMAGQRYELLDAGSIIILRSEVVEDGWT
jgi:hypothetical protein